MKRRKSLFERDLEKLKNQDLFIDIKEIESPIKERVKIKGKTYLNFCSNNYLGLANDSRLKKAAKRAIDIYGVGPAAVRTIAGTLSLHVELEKKLSKFKKAQDAIILQSGFIANLAVIPAITNADWIILSDELNHASIIDACRLSRAKVIRYNHLDTKDLGKKLQSLKVNGQLSKVRCLIATDGVFSMDGDIARLPEIVEIANKYKCLVMVDDAHGEGVLGKHGRGIVDHFKLHGKVDIEVGTLSKAFGVIGGYIAGRSNIIAWLKQRARPFLFSSALTIPDTAAAIEAVNILKNSDRLVKKLWENTKYFKEGLDSAGFDTGKSRTPIVPIMLGRVKLAQKFSKELFKEGVFAMAIGYPTVPKNKARIRVMISATHSENDLQQAIGAFKKVGKKLKVLN